MDILPLPISASSIAQNGIQKGFESLNQYSQQINSSTAIAQTSQIKNGPTESNNNINYDLLNQLTDIPSLETNLIGIKSTELNIKSLVKVLEVENQLFDDTLGRIFDTKV